MAGTEFDRFLGLAAEQVIGYLQSGELPATFPECSQLIRNHISSIPAWQLALPRVACLAVGGDGIVGTWVAGAWFSAYLASEIFDDLEDRQFTPEADIPSPEIAINLATSLIFNAFYDLSLIPDSLAANRASRIFSKAGFSASIGQHMDMHEKPKSVEAALNDYWEAIILKSGSVFMAATGAGAAAGTADEQIIQALAEFGQALGVMLQLFDDCRDAISQSEQAVKHEISLPVLLYLMAIGDEQVHPLEFTTRKQFIELLRGHGVISSISSQLLDWKARAMESLDKLEPSRERLILEKIPDLFLERFQSDRPKVQDGNPA